ncbi:MAG: hypothetical protein RSD96_00945, partial [Bacilli bacterium]
VVLKKNFVYTGSEELYEIKVSGTYYFDAYGSSGEDGGKGGYLRTHRKYEKGDKLIINIGGKNGYNGGGKGDKNGGGATTLKFNNNIIVQAAGGGGGFSNNSYSSQGGNSDGKGGNCNLCNKRAIDGVNGGGGASLKEHSVITGSTFVCFQYLCGSGETLINGMCTNDSYSFEEVVNDSYDCINNVISNSGGAGMKKSCNTGYSLSGEKTNDGCPANGGFCFGEKKFYCSTLWSATCIYNSTIARCINGGYVDTTETHNSFAGNGGRNSYKDVILDENSIGKNNGNGKAYIYMTN